MTTALPPTLPTAGTPEVKKPAGARPRRGRRGTSLFAHGEPMVWLTGGSLVLALLMIIGLLGWVLGQGLGTFWPQRVPQLELVGGERLMGEVSEVERYTPEPTLLDSLDAELRPRAEAELAALDGELERVLLRTGNFDLTNTHYRWVDRYTIAYSSRALGDSDEGRAWQLSPERFRIDTDAAEPTDWSLVVERMAWGRLYGKPVGFAVDGVRVAERPEQVWERFQEFHDEARERWQARRDLETHDVGEVNRDLERARLAARAAELRSCSVTF